MGLILFREAFNLGRILNEARFNLVELRAGKGGDGAAFGRFFRAWAFLRGALKTVDGLVFRIAAASGKGSEAIVGKTINAYKHTLTARNIKVKLVGKIIADLN